MFLFDEEAIKKIKFCFCFQVEDPIVARCARREIDKCKAKGSLGLSGPVVAKNESYWPAKSQVTSGAIHENPELNK